MTVSGGSRPLSPQALRNSTQAPSRPAIPVLSPRTPCGATWGNQALGSQMVSRHAASSTGQVGQQTFARSNSPAPMAVMSHGGGVGAERESSPSACSRSGRATSPRGAAVRIGSPGPRYSSINCPVSPRDTVSSGPRLLPRAGKPVSHFPPVTESRQLDRRRPLAALQEVHTKSAAEEHPNGESDDQPAEVSFCDVVTFDFNRTPEVAQAKPGRVAPSLHTVPRSQACEAPGASAALVRRVSASPSRAFNSVPRGAAFVRGETPPPQTPLRGFSPRRAPQAPPQLPNPRAGETSAVELPSMSALVAAEAPRAESRSSPVERCRSPSQTPCLRQPCTPVRSAPHTVGSPSLSAPSSEGPSLVAPAESHTEGPSARCPQTVISASPRPETSVSDLTAHREVNAGAEAPARRACGYPLTSVVLRPGVNSGGAATITVEREVLATRPEAVALRLAVESPPVFVVEIARPGDTDTLSPAAREQLITSVVAARIRVPTFAGAAEAQEWATLSRDIVKSVVEVLRMPELVAAKESQQPNVPADEMAAGALTEALIGCAVDANSSIALKGTALATLLELVEAVLGSAPAPVGDELAVRAVAIVSGIVAQMPESEAVAGQGDLVTPRAMAEALVKTMGVSMQDVPMQDFVNAMALVPALSKARLGHKQPGNGEFAVSTSMLPVPKVVKSVALSPVVQEVSFEVTSDIDCGQDPLEVSANGAKSEWSLSSCGRSEDEPEAEQDAESVEPVSEPPLAGASPTPEAVAEDPWGSGGDVTAAEVSVASEASEQASQAGRKEARRERRRSSEVHVAFETMAESMEVPDEGCTADIRASQPHFEASEQASKACGREIDADGRKEARRERRRSSEVHVVFETMVESMEVPDEGCTAELPDSRRHFEASRVRSSVGGSCRNRKEVRSPKRRGSEGQARMRSPNPQGKRTSSRQVDAAPVSPVKDETPAVPAVPNSPRVSCTLDGAALSGLQPPRVGGPREDSVHRRVSSPRRRASAGVPRRSVSQEAPPPLPKNDKRLESNKNTRPGNFLDAPQQTSKSSDRKLSSERISSERMASTERRRKSKLDAMDAENASTEAKAKHKPRSSSVGLKDKRGSSVEPATTKRESVASPELSKPPPKAKVPLASCMKAQAEHPAVKAAKRGSSVDVACKTSVSDLTAPRATSPKAFAAGAPSRLAASASSPKAKATCSPLREERSSVAAKVHAKTPGNSRGKSPAARREPPKSTSYQRRAHERSYDMLVGGPGSLTTTDVSTAGSAGTVVTTSGFGADGPVVVEILRDDAISFLSADAFPSSCASSETFDWDSDPEITDTMLDGDSGFIPTDSVDLDESSALETFTAGHCIEASVHLGRGELDIGAARIPGPDVYCKALGKAPSIVRDPLISLDSVFVSEPDTSERTETIADYALPLLEGTSGFFDFQAMHVSDVGALKISETRETNVTSETRPSDRCASSSAQEDGEHSQLSHASGRNKQARMLTWDPVVEEYQHVLSEDDSVSSSSVSDESGTPLQLHDHDDMWRQRPFLPAIEPMRHEVLVLAQDVSLKLDLSQRSSGCTSTESPSDDDFQETPLSEDDSMSTSAGSLQPDGPSEVGVLVDTVAGCSTTASGWRSAAVLDRRGVESTAEVGELQAESSFFAVPEESRSAINLITEPQGSADTQDSMLPRRGESQEVKTIAGRCRAPTDEMRGA